MQADIERQIAALPKLPLSRLRRRYAELFGQQTQMRNKRWLIKRVAWGLQAQAEGGLSERARRRAEQLAHAARLRLLPSQVASPPVRDSGRASLRPARDPRLPAPGTLMTRRYKGRVLQVTVLARGFQFEDRRYRTLSAVARAATGKHCNGYQFFRLAGTGAAWS